MNIFNLSHYQRSTAWNGPATHIEGGPNIYSKLKDSEIALRAPLDLEFDIFVHVYDVAGTFGHINNQSSIVMNENTSPLLKQLPNTALL